MMIHCRVVWGWDDTACESLSTEPGNYCPSLHGRCSSCVWAFCPQLMQRLPGSSVGDLMGQRHNKCCPARSTSFYSVLLSRDPWENFPVSLNGIIFALFSGECSCFVYRSHTLNCASLRVLVVRKPTDDLVLDLSPTCRVSGSTRHIPATCRR